MITKKSKTLVQFSTGFYEDKRGHYVLNSIVYIKREHKPYKVYRLYRCSASRLLQLERKGIIKIEHPVK